jgi:hypothetical protein
MKIVTSSNGKKKIKISKSEWQNIGRKVGWIKIAQTSKVIQRPDGKIVLLNDGLIQHISSHMQQGEGSVFASMPDLESIATQAPIQGDGGLYPFSASGYNLVLPITEAKSLPDAQEDTVGKDERGQKITVPRITTSAPLSQFATNQASIVIRKTPIEYVPENLKTNQNIVAAAQNGNLFSILTAFPGDPNVPPASQWNGQFAIIVASAQQQPAQQQPAQQQPAQQQPAQQQV